MIERYGEQLSWKTVLLALSGGVASAVAGLLLHRTPGHEAGDSQTPKRDLTDQANCIRMHFHKDKGVLEEIPGRLLFLAKKEVCHVLCPWILWKEW